MPAAFCYDGAVKPAPFAYHRPATIPETLALLAELAPEEGRVLAGGQSLVPIMAFRLARPAHLIDINRVAGLDRLDAADNGLRIGALVRHAAFHRPAVAGPLGALLATVARDIAHYPIRMRGTFCGSLAHADPAAEWGLVAATLQAELAAVSVRGERVLRASDFFQGVMETALAPDELLVEARLPLLPEAARYGFAEFSRRPGDYALAMALAVLEIEGGVIANPRLGIGGVEASPRRLAAVEAVLAGAAPSQAVFREAAAIAAAAVAPLEDPQTDAQYRRELVAAMVVRALAGACAEARI
ncbi:MAG: xanthine dehydrogenase family protein subunit M [Alphaproteobacteria bacterium]